MLSPITALRITAFLASCISCQGRADNSTDPIFAIYVDSKGINWAAQPPALIVDTRGTKYTHVICAFYLPSTGTAVDFGGVVLNPNPIYGGVPFIKGTKAAGKKVMISAGGSTEFTGRASYYAQDPVAIANKLVQAVKERGLDGVDLDWQDDWSTGNPGLTGFGAARTIGGGPAPAWLCRLTEALRKGLPREDGYVISHAPQAPYFDIGYVDVHTKCGDSIDFYNVQYYNQAPGKYQSYEGIFEKETFDNTNPNAVGNVADGSVTDLVKRGVPASKIVVGKPIDGWDASNGHIDIKDLPGIIAKGKAKYDIRGVMGWQWGSDTHGAWIGAIANAWEAGPNATAASPATVLI